MQTPRTAVLLPGGLSVAALDALHFLLLLLLSVYRNLCVFFYATFGKFKTPER